MGAYNPLRLLVCFTCGTKLLTDTPINTEFWREHFGHATESVREGVLFWKHPPKFGEGRKCWIRRILILADRLMCLVKNHDYWEGKNIRICRRPGCKFMESVSK